MELLGAGAGLPPLEEGHAVGAASDVTDGVAQHLARRLGRVDGLPVDGARRVLHQQPRPATGAAAGEIGGEREVRPGVGQGVDHVVVVGDEVHLASPGEAVDTRVAVEDEVRRHRNAGAAGVEHVALGDEVGEQGVGAEAGEVEALGRVGERRAVAGRADLRPPAVALAPERRAPRRVQRVDGAVARLEPGAEGRRRGVAVAAGVVAAELVADVPHHHRGVIAVAVGEPFDERQRVVPERRRAGAPRLATAGEVAPAAMVDGDDLRVVVDQPRWRRRRRRRQVDADPAVVQEVEDAVHPPGVERVTAGLEGGPREHADGHEVHAGALHQLDVVAPHRLVPLLRVVVTAEQHRRLAPRRHAS